MHHTPEFLTVFLKIVLDGIPLNRAPTVRPDTSTTARETTRLHTVRAVQLRRQIPGWVQRTCCLDGHDAGRSRADAVVHALKCRRLGHLVPNRV